MDPRTASPGLAELGRRVGASERTLSRLFRDEVGIGYTVWRNQLRLHLATLMLAECRVSPMQIEATNRRQDPLIGAVRDRRSFRYSLLPSASPPYPRSGPPSAQEGRLFSGWMIDRSPVHTTVALDRWWMPPGRDLISGAGIRFR
ncbi:hypothetical protein ASG92_21575 [Arthrobacter sp. Soil736]|nr:hypothetical protein ASG92_21575 [Arthrobacter sp. Soil736]